MKFYGLFLLLFLKGFFLFGQHEEGHFYRHRIAPLMGYVFVPEETGSETTNSVRLIPTFGIDYEFKLHPRWALGWFNDIELSSYVIEYHSHEEALVRENAFITALCLVYSPVHRLALYAGPGYELETHQNFAVIRVGIEYEIPIPDNWDLAFGLSWDHKEVYNSVGITVAFGKRL